jgi:hypothetical protein
MDNTRAQAFGLTNGLRPKPKKSFCVDAKEQAKNLSAMGAIASKDLLAYQKCNTEDKK